MKIEDIFLPPPLSILPHPRGSAQISSSSRAGADTFCSFRGEEKGPRMVKRIVDGNIVDVPEQPASSRPSGAGPGVGRDRKSRSVRRPAYPRACVGWTDGGGRWHAAGAISGRRDRAGGRVREAGRGASYGCARLRHDWGDLRSSPALSCPPFPRCSCEVHFRMLLDCWPSGLPASRNRGLYRLVSRNAPPLSRWPARTGLCNSLM